jgi:hypothetical protein
MWGHQQDCIATVLDPHFVYSPQARALQLLTKLLTRDAPDEATPDTGVLRTVVLPRALAALTNPSRVVRRAALAGLTPLVAAIIKEPALPDATKQGLNDFVDALRAQVRRTGVEVRCSSPLHASQLRTRIVPSRTCPRVWSRK